VAHRVRAVRFPRALGDLGGCRPSCAWQGHCRLGRDAQRRRPEQARDLARCGGNVSPLRSSPAYTLNIYVGVTSLDPRLCQEEPGSRTAHLTGGVHLSRHAVCHDLPQHPASGLRQLVQAHVAGRPERHDRSATRPLMWRTSDPVSGECRGIGAQAPAQDQVRAHVLRRWPARKPGAPALRRTLGSAAPGPRLALVTGKRRWTVRGLQ
jgi:hypothetical protein